MRSKFIKKHCPKCGGNVYLDSDNYGWYEQCLQCGYVYDMESPAEVLDGVSMEDEGILTIEETVTI